jgi:hypothetical protein
MGHISLSSITESLATIHTTHGLNRKQKDQFILFQTNLKSHYLRFHRQKSKYFFHPSFELFDGDSTQATSAFEVLIIDGDATAAAAPSRFAMLVYKL